MAGNAGHHIAAAGSDFIHGNGQRDTMVTQALQLRGCQSVSMHNAAGAFKAHQHFILRGSHRQDGGDFFPQRRDFVRIHTAFKIEHIQPGSPVSGWFALLCQRLSRLRFLLVLFLLRFMPQLLLMRIEQRHRHFFLHVLILLAQAGHPQFAALLLFTLCDVDDNGRHDGNGDNNRGYFG